MHVHRPLRHAGRAGRVQPIGDFVGRRSGRRCAFVLGRQEDIQPRHRRGAAADHDDLLEIGQVGRRFLNDRKQRGRNEDRLGARIFEQVAILIDRQPRIDQNRNDAGADRAPEQDRKVDGIEQNERDPAFRLNAHARQHRTDAGGRVAQLRISQIAKRIDKCGLVAAAFGDVPIHKINRGIVVAKRHHKPRL